MNERLLIYQRCKNAYKYFLDNFADTHTLNNLTDFEKRQNEREYYSDIVNGYEPQCIIGYLNNEIAERKPFGVHGAYDFGFEKLVNDFIDDLRAIASNVRDYLNS